MSAEHPTHEPKDASWYEKKDSHTLIYRGLAGICILLALVDVVFPKKGHFAYEEWWFFYGIFGFAAYSFIVISAKGLRKLISREEDYYDN